MAFLYGLGSEAKDKVTGYRGVIIARTEWLHGCVRYVLQAQKLQDTGKPLEAMSLDEAAIEVIVPADERPISTGGDAPAPERPPDIVR